MTDRLYPEIPKDDQFEGEESFRTTAGSNSSDNDTTSDGGDPQEESAATRRDGRPMRNDDPSIRQRRAGRGQNFDRSSSISRDQNRRRLSESSNGSLNNSDNQNTIYYKILPAIALILIIIIYCVYVSVSSVPAENNITKDSVAEGNEFFTKHIKLLQRKYRKQDKSMWPMIKASIKSVLNSSNPLSPSVILLLSSEMAMATNHDLSKELASITAGAFHVRYPTNTSDDYESFYCGSLMTKTPEKAKLRLDNILNNAFHTKHVALLFDVEKLPEDTALILHSYCDNTNAPYKNVVIYLTVTCESELINSNKNWDEIGDICMKRYLLAKKGLNEDKIAALMSRIGNSVVVIVREE